MAAGIMLMGFARKRSPAGLSSGAPRSRLIALMFAGWLSTKH